MVKSFHNVALKILLSFLYFSLIKTNFCNAYAGEAIDCLWQKRRTIQLKVKNKILKVLICSPAPEYFKNRRCEKNTVHNGKGTMRGRPLCCSITSLQWPPTGYDYCFVMKRKQAIHFTWFNGFWPGLSDGIRDFNEESSCNDSSFGF